MSNPYMTYPNVYPNVNQGYQQNKFYNQPQYQNVYPPVNPPVSYNVYPPQQQQQQQPSTPSNIIVVSNANAATATAPSPSFGGGAFCPVCLMNTGSYVTRGYGTQAATWCLILCLLTGCLCWIPFVMQGCKQQQIRCVNCSTIKRRI